MFVVQGKKLNVTVPLVAFVCLRGCGQRCMNKVLVKDGVVVRQKTDDTHEDSLLYPQQRSCLRGRSLVEFEQGADRMKYPLKRISWQPGDPHGELRGTEGYERISWDEALDYVAGELKKAYTTYDPRSLYVPTSLSGSRFAYGPLLNASAAMLDAHWIPVKSGSDTAFLIGVAGEMLKLDAEKGGIVDWDFFHTYCVGFDAKSMPEGAATDEHFKGYLEGKYDGVVKDAAWASAICGTPESEISWFARTVGKKSNVYISHGYAGARCNDLRCSDMCCYVCMPGVSVFLPMRAMLVAVFTI